jgi:gluconolactonase
MSQILLSSLVVLLICATAVHSADSPVIAPGAKVEKLAGDFQFTEGPAADADGNVFFTDQPNAS